MKKRALNSLKPLFAALFLVGLFHAPSANAQAPLLVEGPIQAVRPAQNVIVVMGVRVTVPPGTPITTPTTNLTDLAAGTNPLSLLLGDPLPGRGTTPGFIGGTAIINGTVTAAGVPTATDVFVEPSENIMMGTVTEAVCATARCAARGDVLRVNGTRMQPIRDPRMAAGPVTNEFGFAADLTGFGTIGTPAEAEGYFDGRRFRYFLLVVTGAPLVNSTVPEVSITRAQCRRDPGGIELDVLGFTHPQGGDLVTVSNGAGTTVYGTQATIAAGRPGFGAYTFRLRNNPAFTACPANVLVEFRNATATVPVDIIP